LARRILAGWWAWGPAVLVAAALWPRLPILTLHEDEGVVTMWGLQVAAGNVPYRDFVVYSGPANAYLYGASFWLFGPSLLLDRLLDAAPIIIGTLFLALIGRRFLPAAWAAAAALLWGIWLPPLIGYGAYHFWGPALVVVMAWALLEPQPRPVLAGVAGALALLFYQAIAPAVLCGLLVAYLSRRRVRDLLETAAGPVLAGALFGVLLLVTGAFGGFLDQTLVFTFSRYKTFHPQPFPWNPALLGDVLNWHSGPAAFWAFPMFWLFGVVVPFIIAGYAAVALWRVARDRAPLGNRAALAILSTGLLGSAFITHIGGPIFWLSAPLVLVLVAVWLRQALESPSRVRRLVLVPAAGIVFLTGLSPAPVGLWLSCTINPGAPLARVDTVAGPVCVLRKEAPELRQVQQVAAQPRSGAIAFLPDSPSLYLLTASRPVVPSYWTLPSSTRDSELAWEERAMLAQVEYAVYVADLDLDVGHPWPFDGFLAANYESVATSPGVIVYRRRA
jgi:hypothetical protein